MNEPSVVQRIGMILKTLAATVGWVVGLGATWIRGRIGS